MYWTAPELLRQPGLFHDGTPKGDVYSFAIILWELVDNSRSGPFHEINLEPKGAEENPSISAPLSLYSLPIRL